MKKHKMNNRRIKKQRAMTESNNSANAESTMFSFDAAEVMNNDFCNYDYNELFYNDSEGYWEPPLDRGGLNKLTRANAYHGSILNARCLMIAGRYQGGGMEEHHVHAAINDFLQFGDVAIIKIRNGFKQVIALHPMPAMHTRKDKKGNFILLGRDGEQKKYKKNDVIFVPRYDSVQQVYGIPDYLGCVQSALLSSDATTFRRRYYKNGLHMGFIFYASDPNLGKEDEAELKEKMASSRGVGNFRSMFVNIPNGKEKGIQLIPVGDIATKDEFEKIKNITAQEILTGHRYPMRNRWLSDARHCAHTRP